MTKQTYVFQFKDKQAYIQADHKLEAYGIANNEFPNTRQGNGVWMEIVTFEPRVAAKFYWSEGNYFD
jgi:hypothetical protein